MYRASPGSDDIFSICQVNGRFTVMQFNKPVFLYIEIRNWDRIKTDAI